MTQYIILSAGDILNLSKNNEIYIYIDGKKYILCSDECYDKNCSLNNKNIQKESKI